MGLIGDAVTKAENSLKGAFGEEFQSQGEGAGRFLNQEQLAEAYSKEACSDVIFEEFTQMANSIRKMRSSYLPIDFYIDEKLLLGLDEKLLSATLVNETSGMESYENAFMRMLGMPLVGTGTSSDSLITSGSLTTMNSNTGIPEPIQFDIIKTKILDERKKVKSDRKIKIDNSIFRLQDALAETNSSIAERDFSLVAEEAFGATKGPDGLLVLPAVEDRFNDPKISNIETDLFKFSYLLIPPIQDGRISGCINETQKIVAPPFSNPRARNINNDKIRPTLLESVIRIRLDKISGTGSFSTGRPDSALGGELDSAAESLGIGTGDGDDSTKTDDFGILESLFILRLRSALSGLAKKTMRDVDQIIMEILKSKREPTPKDEGTGADAPATPAKASTQMEKTTGDGRSPLLDEKVMLREQQKLIEDSIMILLGDNSEVLDLQVQSQRNSSIQNAHLMSGIIDVVDIPRKRIERELSEIEEARNETAKDNTDHITTNLETILGADIGVGTVDIVVFSLALFSIDESSLLGLLSQDAFDKLKNDITTAPLLPNEGEKLDTLIAINNLTEFLIEGYQLFVEELRDDRAGARVLAINHRSSSRQNVA
jgi:hypothetical protein